jgi:biopolymer transport protein ExbD
VKLRVPGTDATSDDIDMTPMIDVVFQLIIFFMVASTFVDQARVFQIALPRAAGEGAVTIRTDDVPKIAVSKDGRIAMDDLPKAVAGLVDDLKAYRKLRQEAGKEAVVIIAADRDARYERVIQVWNAVKSAGIDQVSFQVERGLRPGAPGPCGRVGRAGVPAAAGGGAAGTGRPRRGGNETESRRGGEEQGRG